MPATCRAGPATCHTRGRRPQSTRGKTANVRSVLFVAVYHFTLEETETHKRNCKLGKLNCGRCRYWDLMANDHSRFAMLRLRPTDQLAFKARKVEVLAKLPWLALRHDSIKGGAWVGCMACHAYVRERPQKAKANPYADFHIKAARLVDRAKPHIMMRHAKTRLHLQAVAAMLDVPCGAQVNILLKSFQQYRWPPGCSCAPRSFGDPLSPISFRILTGRSFRHCQPALISLLPRCLLADAEIPRRACASKLGLARTRAGATGGGQVQTVRASRWRPRQSRSSSRCSATFGPASRSAQA